MINILKQKKLYGCMLTVWLQSMLCLYNHCNATSQKAANCRPLPPVLTNDFVPPCVTACKQPARSMMSFSSSATSRCCLFHRSFLVFESQGERFISSLRGEGGSCLSERACWIKGLFPQRGGYQSECHSGSTALHVAREPLLHSPSPPSLCHQVILLFLHVFLHFLFLCLVYIFFSCVTGVMAVPCFPPAGSMLLCRE